MRRSTGFHAARSPEKSPFVDFIENFKKEYGLELVLEEEVQNYIETVAKRENLEVSATIKKLLSGASALNYMNQKEPFTIIKEMLEDPKYFDSLFTDWHEKFMKQNP